MPADLIAGIRKDRLAAFAAREAATYAKARPKAAKAMAKGAGRLPGRGADALDGRLADAASAAGRQGPWRPDRGYRRPRAGRFLPGRHRSACSAIRPAPVARAIRHQARHGLTYMLPTEAALAGRAAADRPLRRLSAGRSPPPRPTPTALPCASPARSPGGPRCWSSTAAITARSTTPSSPGEWRPPSPPPACWARSTT
jgi:hypothetical protein